MVFIHKGGMYGLYDSDVLTHFLKVWLKSPGMHLFLISLRTRC